MPKALVSGDPRRLGRYELVAVLGEGGMGRVFLGRGDDGRQVAVKVIRPEIANDADFRRRFRNEVSRARQVPPFSTAEVIDADPDHDPPYLVVEYVNGPSLADVVAHEGPLTAANLHGIAVGVAAALTAIHHAGVIHRDLKPANVLLARGSPKVIDFGIAKPAVDPTTVTDGVLGTIPYIAPERFYPAERARVTPATDIFAWGAIVAFAATGRNPFSAATTGDVIGRILHGTPDLAGLTEPLHGLVEQALAKEPDRRPTARQLLDHLTAAGPTTPRARRGWIRLGIAAAAALMAAIATTVWILVNNTPTGIPTITADPHSLDFGSVTKGSSRTMTVTIRNSGTVDLRITSISLQGQTSDDYHTAGCSLPPLPPNGSCQIAITFEPTTTGRRAAAIVIRHNGASNTTPIQLTGTGVAVRLTRTVSIPTGKYYDLDSGVQTSNSDSRADLFFGGGWGYYFVTPKHGAQAAEAAAAAASPGECSGDKLQPAAIELHVDIIFCARTNQGRLSVVTVTELPDAGDPNFTIRFTTWE